MHSHTYLTNARARRHAPKTLSVTLLLPFFILWLHSLGRPSVRPLGFWCGGWSPTAPTVAVETNPRAANPGGKHAQHTCWVRAMEVCCVDPPGSFSPGSFSTARRSLASSAILLPLWTLWRQAFHPSDRLTKSPIEIFVLVPH